MLSVRNIDEPAHCDVLLPTSPLTVHLLWSWLALAPVSSDAPLNRMLPALLLPLESQMPDGVGRPSEPNTALLAPQPPSLPRWRHPGQTPAIS